MSGKQPKSDAQTALQARLVALNGETGTLLKLVEELSELSAAVCRLAQGRDERADVAGEQADVELMLEQLRSLWGPEYGQLVDIARKEKVERGIARLAEGGIAI